MLVLASTNYLLILVLSIVFSSSLLQLSIDFSNGYYREILIKKNIPVLIDIVLLYFYNFISVEGKNAYFRTLLLTLTHVLLTREPFKV